MTRAISEGDKLLLLGGLPLLIVIHCSVAGPALQRWYSESRVTEGKALYAIHCAGCHGERAEATPNWKQRLEDGSLPPPPLNGTAHSWHHQMPVLRRAINEGGQAFGGTMPGFSEKLTPEEVDSVIAWFQSLWSDEIYRMWSGEGMDLIEQPQLIRDLLEDM